MKTQALGDDMSVTVERTADVIDSIGVNTHLPYTDGAYADFSTVLADIQYLGLTNARDGISDGLDGAAPLSSYITLAQAGIKFTINLFSGGTVAAADVTAQLAVVAQLEAAVPGSVIAVEGANEINNFPLTFNGVGGLTGAVALQTAIYTAVQSDPALAGVAVDYFTGYGAGDVAAGPDPATTLGLANYDTQHPYPTNGEPPDLAVDPSEALSNETAPYGPAVYTETGYSTNGGTTGDVNADVQAKYTLDLLMDDAKNGIAETYIYQLLDAYAPDSTQGDSGYGLFDYTGAPKEAAVAIHDLTTILADSGANATTFATTPLDYTLGNLPSTGNSLELQKSDGATDIVVWNEPEIWDESTGTEITVAPTSVDVDLGATYQTVEVFDPLTSASPIETLTDVSELTLSVTDHPLIVEVEPDSAVSCFAAGTRILTERGAVPVERLAVGDQAVTAAGARRAIIWIGSRRIDCRRHAQPDMVRPIRIAAEAFGPGQPARDLILSPDHAIFAEDVLIPVKHLVNGISIRQTDADVITYFHVELATHEILLAEALPVESYIDGGDRTAFGAGGAVALHPVWGGSSFDRALLFDALGYAQLRVTGVAVDRVRSHLARRAAASPASGSQTNDAPVTGCWPSASPRSAAG
jgi:hypothetical protein